MRKARTLLEYLEQAILIQQCLEVLHLDDLFPRFDSGELSEQDVKDIVLGRIVQVIEEERKARTNGERTS